MDELTKNRRMMRWIWTSMHRSQLKMPPDQLIFEGDHDLIFIYNNGLVDTDRVTQDQWIAAFKESRQKDGSYLLTLEQWLDKAQYRYGGPVDPPFDPQTIREGEWSLEDCKKFIKDKVLPETTVTYEQFLNGLETSQEKGEFHGEMITITPEKKQGMARLMEQFPSARRRRAMAVEHYRKQEEFEASRARVTQTQTKKAVTPEQEKTKYKSAPEESKQATGKLSDLLSGSKK